MPTASARREPVRIHSVIKPWRLLDDALRGATTHPLSALCEGVRADEADRFPIRLERDVFDAESGGGANDRGCGLMGPAGGEFSFSARRFRRLGSSERGGRWAPLAERLEWWWKCRARPIAARALALVLGAFSVLTVWAESTMWTTQAAPTRASWALTVEQLKLRWLRHWH